MEKMNIKGAIFDCDGTLVDSLGFWDVFYVKIGEHFFGGKEFKVAPEDDRAMRTQAVGFLSNLLHSKYGIAESPKAMEKWCLDLFAWYYTEVVELKAGVRELLEHLKKSGVRICIASAAEKDMIELVLGKHKVLDYFEGIISCTKVGAGKDKPDVFLAAEEFLGTPHEETWIFEDSLLAMQTASKAGFKLAGIYDKHTFGQDEAREICDLYVEDGGSFADLIPQLFD